MRWLILIIGIFTSMAEAEWAPPKNTDPGDVYREAVSDRQNGRFDKALTKHIWFHENAIDIEPAYAGIRLSYNLIEWSTLGEEYPQAKAALLKKAAEARESVVNSSECDRDMFHDYIAINTYLNASQDSVDLFIWLEENRPEKAKKFFNLAFSDLLEAREYQLLSKYIEPFSRLEKINKMYEMNLKDSSDSEMGKELKAYAEQYFTYNVGALVAILINSNQQQTAHKVAKLSAGKVDTELYKTVMHSALNGTPPDKWP